MIRELGALSRCAEELTGPPSHILNLYKDILSNRNKCSLGLICRATKWLKDSICYDRTCEAQSRNLLTAEDCRR